MNLKNIIFIIYIILLLLNKGFYFWYPSLNINLLCHGTTCIEKALLFLFMTTALKMKQYIKKLSFFIYSYFITEKQSFSVIMKQRFIFKRSGSVINIFVFHNYIYNLSYGVYRKALLFYSRLLLLY